MIEFVRNVELRKYERGFQETSFTLPKSIEGTFINRKEKTLQQRS